MVSLCPILNTEMYVQNHYVKFCHKQVQLRKSGFIFPFCLWRRVFIWFIDRYPTFPTWASPNCLYLTQNWTLNFSPIWMRVFSVPGSVSAWWIPLRSSRAACMTCVGSAASSMYCVISSRPTLMLARVLEPKSTSGGLQTSAVSLQYLNMANCLFSKEDHCLLCFWLEYRTSC